MKWDDLADSDCAMSRALSVVGDRWTMVIVREALLGTRRFDDFCRRVGAARHIVAARLAALVGAGCLERIETNPRRVEYRLTDQGHALLPVVIALLDWGDRWISEGREPGLRFVHTVCGEQLDPSVRCSTCGTVVAPAEVQPRFTDGHHRARSASGC